VIVRGGNDLALSLPNTLHQLLSSTLLRDDNLGCGPSYSLQNCFTDNMFYFLDVFLGGADYDLGRLVLE